MAYISFQPSDFFNTTLYNGNASTQAITGVGFQPDLTWLKSYDTAGTWHYLTDSVRGVGKQLYSNSDSSQGSNPAVITAFDSDGFSLGDASDTNGSGVDCVAWSWKAGTTSGLSGGTITPSSYSINATAGIGIYKWTGTGATGTIAHGLGTAPKMMIIKSLGVAANWGVYNEAIGNSNTMFLDLTNASTARTYYNSTSPTSTVFTVKDGVVNDTGSDYIAYVFADVNGLSKMGC